MSKYGNFQTPGGTPHASEAGSSPLIIENAHPELGQLISTLQELASEYPTSDGDELCCNFNELMYPKEFKEAVGKSRRSGVVKPLLVQLQIRFEKSLTFVKVYTRFVSHLICTAHGQS